jgi:hypothetical protein
MCRGPYNSLAFTDPNGHYFLNLCGIFNAI